MEGANYLLDGINTSAGTLGAVKMVQELCPTNTVPKSIEYSAFG